jgi:hypothetical protein
VVSALSAAALGVGVVSGPAPAFAAETASGTCTADEYEASAAVKYRRAGDDLFIGGVALKIDEDAGPRNRVRLVVRKGGTTAFTYTSRNDITPGPYSFDYQDHPIRVRGGGTGEIRVEVTVDFDGEDSPRCTAVVRI